MNTQKNFAYPLLASGFRTFFALAGLSALFLMLVWNAIFKDGAIHANYFSPTVWHAHEMLLGYTVAVIAGFLLTAVKNWTGQPTITGKALGGLAMVWLYGRILPFYSGLLPDVLIALVDLSFLPLLAWQVSRPILAAKQPQYLLFVGLLLLIALGNALIHVETLGLADHLAGAGLQLVVGTMVTLILVVAGKVLPFFVERGIKGTLIMRHPLLDALAIGSAAVMFLLQLFNQSGMVLMLAAVLALLANGARLVSWYVPRIWYVPLLWILYLGYAWLMLGFALTALAAFNWVVPVLALHAFTVGGIAVLTLGMMARVSLGHTGRALQISNTIAIAFVLINLSAVLRELLPMALPDGYNLLVYLASLAWLAAFALFVGVYLPMLTAARADGQAD